MDFHSCFFLNNGEELSKGQLQVLQVYKKKEQINFQKFVSNRKKVGKKRYIDIDALPVYA